MRSLPTAFLTSGVFASLSIAASSDDLKCVDGLYMIMARGTGEPKGSGAMSAIGERLVDRISGSEYIGLDYPASERQAWSIEKGSNSLRQHIEDYAEACPDGKIALFGYSQGAQVTGNAVCGEPGRSLEGTPLDGTDLFEKVLGTQGNETEFAKISPVSKDTIQDNVISIVLLGDPTFDSKADFAEGTSESEGLWKRDWKSCGHYDDIFKSWCDKGDIICDAKAKAKDINLAAHLTYVQNYGDGVVEFVLEQWNGASGADVEVDGGGKIDDEEIAAGISGAATTPTSSAGSTMVTPSPTEEGETEPTPSTGAASGRNIVTALLFGVPLAAVWQLL